MLLDLNVQPSLIAGSLSTIILQRLVPKICDHCKVEMNPSDISLRHFEHHKMDTPASLFKGTGCSKCRFTGRLGMHPIFEIVHMNTELSKFVETGFSLTGFKDIWMQSGGIDLIQYGLEDVRSGYINHEYILNLDSNFL